MADNEQHNAEVILDREGSLNGYQKTSLSGETVGSRVTDVLYRNTILIAVVILSQMQYKNITKIYEVLLFSMKSCKTYICCNMFPDSVKVAKHIYVVICFLIL